MFYVIGNFSHGERGIYPQGRVSYSKSKEWLLLIVPLSEMKGSSPDFQE
jgi:hypothetical protein